MSHAIQKKWWMEAIIYQIYPQSFFDTNHDGFGDLQGIIQKLGYIKSLGVDAIWISPIYPSPLKDNGYDVSDYRDIHPRYGSIEDWKQLLEIAHEHGIRVIMDLVINHSSSEHRWFQEAKSSRSNQYHDYYIWKDAEHGSYPNNWRSHFSTPAWTWNEATKEYYLHLFDPSQPDLNWENPLVRKEMCDIGRFWMQLGADGFRLDCASLISKSPGLPSSTHEPPLGSPRGIEYFFNGPRIHEYLKEFCQAVYRVNPEALIVGECPGVDVAQAAPYVGFHRSELSMLIQFELWPPTKWKENTPSLKEFADHYERWAALQGKGWHASYLSNHDQPRAISRFGDEINFRKESAKTLLLMQCTTFGTPYIYQGEEIAMTNVAFDNIAHYRDIDTLNYYEFALKKGVDAEALMQRIHALSRDNSRTPMQWSSDEHAGFSDHLPWIGINSNYKDINVAKEEKDPHSVLSFFRKLTALRKQFCALIYGDLRSIYLDDSLWIFERSYEQEKVSILIHFGTQGRALPDIALKGALIHSTIQIQDLAQLQPWEGRIYAESL